MKTESSSVSKRLLSWRWFCLLFLICQWVMLSCSGESTPRVCREAGDCLAGEYCEPATGHCRVIPCASGRLSETDQCLCRDDQDCQITSYCSPQTRLCAPTPCVSKDRPRADGSCPCRTGKDCSAGQLCDPKTLTCGVTCPSGEKPRQGACACSKPSDCPAGTYCDSFQNTQGICRDRCPVSGVTPQGNVCPCPDKWTWHPSGACLPACPQDMTRRSDGVCVPDLPALLPDIWERNKDDSWRMKCGDSASWQRDASGVCRFRFPVVAGKQRGPLTAEEILSKTGPQKICPKDPKDKWDDVRVTEIKTALQRPEIPVIYVDSAAPTAGNGSRERPYQLLQQGVDNVASGGIVLVAPGTYVWGLRITKPVYVVGRCTQGVQIISRPGSTAAPGVYVGAGQGTVVIEGLSLLGAGQARQYGVFAQDTGRLELRDVRVQKASTIGIMVLRGGALLERLEVSGTVATSEMSGYTFGVRSEQSTAAVVISDSRIHNNMFGVAVLQNRQSFVLQRSWLREHAIGAYVAESQSVASILYNHLSESRPQASLPAVGILAQKAKQPVYIEDNLVRNGTLLTDSLGVSLDECDGGVFVRYNQVQEHLRANIRVFGGANVVIEGNLVQGNGKGLLRLGSVGPFNVFPTGVGIHLRYAHWSGSVKVRDNAILNHRVIGLFLLGMTGPVEVRRNLLENTGPQQEKTRGIEMFGGTFQTKVAHNRIRGFTEAGITYFDQLTGKNTDLRVEGNWIQSPSGFGVSVQARVEMQEQSGLTVSKNWLQGAGLSIRAVENVTVTYNLVDANGASKPGQNEAGLLMIDHKILATIRGNTFTGYVLGGRLFRWREKVQGKFSDNVWALNQHAGLYVADNRALQQSSGEPSATFSFENEHFFRNGNVHLWVINNQTRLTVKDSSFVQSYFTKGLANKGQVWSPGIGVWVGALGLTRLVFAKDADYPCSPTQKQQLSSLPDGWTMRPVRIPYEMDPCSSWDFTRYRTPEGRQQAGACEKKCKQGERCRWVWNESSTLAGKGLWSPGSLLCVPADQPHTCDDTRLATSSFSSVLAEALHHGQCRKLTQDSCNTPQMQQCHTLRNSSNEQSHYCKREVWTPAKGVEVYCASNQDGELFCRPKGARPLCEDLDGYVCIDNEVSLQPMNVFPSRLTLEQNTFWHNPGPDVFMDMAGRVRLLNNRYGFCTPGPKDPTCLSKSAYQRCVLSSQDASCERAQENSLQGYKKVGLPAGKTIVWQNPSPYAPPYDSLLDNRDKPSLSGSIPLLYEPTLCDVFATQSLRAR